MFFFYLLLLFFQVLLYTIFLSEGARDLNATQPSCFRRDCYKSFSPFLIGKAKAVETGKDRCESGDMELCCLLLNAEKRLIRLIITYYMQLLTNTEVETNLTFEWDSPTFLLFSENSIKVWNPVGLSEKSTVTKLKMVPFFSQKDQWQKQTIGNHLSEFCQNVRAALGLYTTCLLCSVNNDFSPSVAAVNEPEHAQSTPFPSVRYTPRRHSQVLFPGTSPKLGLPCPSTQASPTSALCFIWTPPFFNNVAPFLSG